MKLYDQSTQDLVQAVQDVLEGKTAVKEMKYPHDMFDPKTGKKEVAKDEAEHKALDAKGYTNEAPKENVAGPADLSVDQNVKKVQAKHGAVKKVDLTVEDVLDEAINPSDSASMYGGRAQLKLSKYLKSKIGAKGAYFDGNSLVGSMKNAYASKTTLSGALDPKNKYTVQDLIDALKNQKEDVEEAEMSAKQAAYRKVFDAAMKKFGVKSPAELEGDKKKEFFDYVDANYEADGEVKEGLADFFKSKKKKAGVDKDKTAAAIGAKVDKDMIQKYKDKIANAKAKANAADKAGDSDKEDYWNEVLYNAEKDLDELESPNEGVGDFFNKAKKAVQKGVDKVTGADKKKSAYSAQAGATAALSRRAKPGGKSGGGDQIQKLKDKIARAKILSKAADKAGDSDKEDYWNEVIYNAEAELDKLKAK